MYLVEMARAVVLKRVPRRHSLVRPKKKWKPPSPSSKEVCWFCSKACDTVATWFLASFKFRCSNAERYSSAQTPTSAFSGKFWFWRPQKCFKLAFYILRAANTITWGVRVQLLYIVWEIEDFENRTSRKWMQYS